MIKHNNFSLTLGIDPGVTGAVSVFSFDGECHDLYEFKKEEWGKVKKRNRIDARSLFEFLSAHIRPDNDVAYMEATHAMPKNGAIAAYSQGDSAGVIRGVCAALRVPIIYVQPNEWKKYYGLIRPSVPGFNVKDASLQLARRMFPAESLEKKKDHNKAEALLIGSYGLDQRTLKGDQAAL